MGATYDIDLNCTVVSHCLHVTVLSFLEFCSKNCSQIGSHHTAGEVCIVTLAFTANMYVTVMCGFFFIQEYLLFTYCRDISLIFKLWHFSCLPVFSGNDSIHHTIFKRHYVDRTSHLIDFLTSESSPHFCTRVFNKHVTIIIFHRNDFWKWAIQSYPGRVRQHQGCSFQHGGILTSWTMCCPKSLSGHCKSVTFIDESVGRNTFHAAIQPTTMATLCSMTDYRKIPNV